MESRDHLGDRFLRVLQEVGLEAKDLIVTWLQGDEDEDDGKDLCAARASCRALRDLVDGSIRKGDIYVRSGDLDRWDAGDRPPLHRWQRCTKVAILLDDAGFLRDDPVLAGDLLTLPFIGMSPEARSRIRSLSIYVAGTQDIRNMAFFHGTSLASLLQSLPALRSVRIPYCMPVPDYQRQLLVDALASLPDLEELELPVSPVIERLGCLAAPCRNLRRLRLAYLDRGVLDAQVMRGVGRLTQLQELSARIDDDQETLRTLLQGRPASLRTLQVQESFFLDPLQGRSHPVFRFADGHLVEVEVNVCYAGAFLRFVSTVLMPSGEGDGSSGSGGAPMPLQRLRRLYLKEMCVGAKDGDSGLHGPEAERASQLLRRCLVEIERVYVDPDTPSRDVLRAIEVLGGALPRKITLGSEVCPDVEFELRPDSCTSRQLALSVQPAAAAVNATADTDAAGEPRPPCSCSLADMVLARLTLASVGSSGRGSRGCSAPAVACAAELSAAASVRSAEGQTRVWNRRVLLLRGPLLAGLAWAPTVLGAWLQQLKVTAVGAGIALTEEPMLQCLALPGAHAALLHCGSHAAAAAMAAAAIAAAAGAQAAAGGGGAACQLQVRPVVNLKARGSASATESFSVALQQVAQRVCDGEPSAWCGGRSQMQRLQWLLEEWEGLGMYRTYFAKPGCTPQPA